MKHGVEEVSVLALVAQKFISQGKVWLEGWGAAEGRGQNGMYYFKGRGWGSMEILLMYDLLRESQDGKLLSNGVSCPQYPLSLTPVDHGRQCKGMHQGISRRKKLANLNNYRDGLLKKIK